MDRLTTICHVWKACYDPSNHVFILLTFYSENVLIQITENATRKGTRHANMQQDKGRPLFHNTLHTNRKKANTKSPSLLGCCAVSTFKHLSTFRRSTVLPPSASSSAKSSSVPKKPTVAQPKILDWMTLQKEALRNFEKSVTIYQSTWRHIPEDLNLQQDFHYNPKARKAHWIPHTQLKVATIHIVMVNVAYYECWN